MNNVSVLNILPSLGKAMHGNLIYVALFIHEADTSASHTIK